MKICATCKISLSLESFGKDKHNNDGLNYSCKKCKNKKTLDRIEVIGKKTYYKIRNNKSKPYRLKYYENKKDKWRDYYLQKKLGKSLNDYWILFNSQNKKCAICDIEWDPTQKLFAWDHDHDSNVIRGILCETCNRGLGLLKDNISVLENSINYLRKYKKKT